MRVARGKTAKLECPARSYPEPTIEWLKDGEPLSNSDKHQLAGKTLHIRELDDADQGIYRCIASNEFSQHIENQKQRFTALLDQELRATSSVAWLVPLAIILLILILLAAIIYGFSFFKRRETQRYNVADHE